MIALHEIWSIGREYIFPGYQKLLFTTRDQDLPIPNRNCGGGVGLLVKNDLQFSVLSFPNQFSINIYESIWIKLELGGSGGSVIIGNVYRPDTFGKADLPKALQIHFEILTLIKSDPKLRKSKLLILGDFNLDLIKCDSTPNIDQYLTDNINLSLAPIITRPTRIEGQSALLIDHIFTTSVNIAAKGIILFDISDHFPIFCIDGQKTTVLENKNNTFERDTSQKNIDSLTASLASVDWTKITDISDPQTAFTEFNCILTTKTELAFPFKKVTISARSKKKNRGSPWFSPALAASLKTKNRLFAKKCRKPTMSNCENFLVYKRCYNKVCRAAKKLYYEE